MKRIIVNLSVTGLFLCFFHTAAYSWIYIDTSQVPGIPADRYLQVVSQLDGTISGNAKNYPGALALANVGGYPIGDAYIGDFPHLFVGVSAALGCGNMKYYDENKPRVSNIYPAYAPNAALYFGFGLGRGYDILIKAMVFSSAIYRPPLNQKSAKLSKMNLYSLGAKIRKNVVGKKSLIPYIFNFGGITVSAGADYMQTLIGIKGEYKYKLGNFSVAPVGPVPFTLDAYYNFNLKWLMLAANAQALVYVDFLWIFDFYTGVGMAVTYGSVALDGSGIGPVTRPNPANPLVPVTEGMTFARARYLYHPRAFMGLFIAGLEINLWVLKLNFETMVNITNGKDISLQVGTRFQF
jgi:hypothetical protein